MLGTDAMGTDGAVTDAMGADVARTDAMGADVARTDAMGADGAVTDAMGVDGAVTDAMGTSRPLLRDPVGGTARRASALPGEDGSARLTRACDGALDVAVVVLATWTVVYHACLALRLTVSWAVAMEVLALTAVAVVWHRGGGGPSNPLHDRRPDAAEQVPFRTASRLDRLLAGLTVLGASTTAVLLATNASWPLVAAGWLATTVAGTGWAALRHRTAVTTGARAAPIEARPPARRYDAVIALTWAAGLAVLAMYTLWPNPDDLYYVNLSQWIVEHGTFPLRDTIFSDLVFPMSTWPPLASYDALVGTTARLAGVHAASIAYVVVPPVATFLSVLALWRLLRAWRVRMTAVALSVALAFLLFDGGPGYAAPGNLFLIRLWQGKVILLCLLVPLLLVYAVRYVERPSRRSAAWLFTGGIASVALSTTAIFLIPLLAIGAMAPLALRRPRQALSGLLALAAYPLAAGVLTLAVGGRSADDFGSRRLYRFDPAWFGHEIFRDGPLALIAGGAVLVGALTIPHRSARVTAGVLGVITGISFVPGVTRLSYDLVGLGPTLWRVSWIATIAAFVGVLATYPGRLLATYPGRARSYRLVAYGIPIVVVGALVGFGLPIWSAANGVRLAAPPHWQRSPEAITAANRAIAAVPPGAVILAPEDLAVTIDVTTTTVKTVAPRAYFMDYLQDNPAFHYDERQTLLTFANEPPGTVDRTAVAAALDVLGPDEVCLVTWEHGQLRFVHRQGYVRLFSTPTYTCLTR